MSKLFLIRPGKLKEMRDDSPKKKEWSSDSDLHRLPPLSPSTSAITSPRLSRKEDQRLLTPRPPTPCPNRRENFIVGKSRLVPLSPTNSAQRLSLNLDTLKEEIVAIEDSRKNGSPDRDKISLLDSPRMCVRSLPSSPIMRRSVSRQRSNPPLRRLNSDSEHSSKEDRIVEWIRDVQMYENSVFSDDTVESTSDSSEQELSSSPGLPAIQEDVTYRYSSLS